MINNELSLPVPVIIVEDEPLIQVRLKEILLNIGYMPENLFFATNLKQAHSLLQRHSVSFALIDLGLPDGNGIDFIKTLKKYDPSILVLVVSAWSTEDAILMAISAGATGYVLKERDNLEVMLSIRSVLRGGAPIDPFIAQKILQKLHLDESSSQVMSIESTKKQENTEVLSKREQEILILVSQGLSNKEIAEQLNLSRYTIESHVKHIYRKLSVSTRIMAVDVGRNLGILD
ncbi:MULTISPECIES: response regulator transcription factor [Acinetobacter]|uniref:Response regulator transcription factor n=1 Tax=Acinetobacter piscicola TaxID=2006115 RepID=A0A4Q4H315_9GAMM|nr:MULTISPECIES: response regulator transcription factor [Acinetobacter]MDM1756602.1 response regulator transcription factor [Acinetobacter sp. 256-1]MDM1759672.1 response regulator transcription factor [Acinetobacter sp. 251-1]QOW45671.1 response regulator transcription factor [Acinetobacter piscicola]RYL28334.1 response regulator transcription factor [Acinetobacter piscicola]